TPFGHKLARPGGAEGEEIVVDWRASGSLVVSGLANGGKSVLVTALLADRVSNGAYLACLDTAEKAVDFARFKSLCAVPGTAGKLIPTWGCDSLPHTVAVLAMLCEEGKARAKVLAEIGVNNWLDMPDDKRFRPIFIIADEYEALVSKTPEPKALPADHPIRVEIAEENIAHDLIAYYTNRLVKEFRFVGLHVLISTQVSNATTGLPPSLKGKIGHFALCGSTPSEAARKQAFPDEKAVPRVPEHIATAGPVALGTGSAKIEGAGSAVFKSYFASIREYADALKALGVDRYTETQVTPTAAQIDEYMPRLDDGSGHENDAPTPRGGGERAPSGRPAAEVRAAMGDDAWDVDPETGEKLTGYAKANAARAAAAKGERKTTGDSEW
ncbi:MAG: hypothetical protein ACRCYU_02275, partial [Nocardioides sp.]